MAHIIVQRPARMLLGSGAIIEGTGMLLGRGDDRYAFALRLPYGSETVTTETFGAEIARVLQLGGSVAAPDLYGGDVLIDFPLEIRGQADDAATTR